MNFELFVQIFLVFFKISVLSFGGVFGVLPELEKLVVHEHGWISSEQFIQSYVVSQFVPGPNMAMCPLIGYWVASWSGFVAGFLGIYSGPFLVMGVVQKFIEGRSHLAWIRRFEIALRPLVLGLVSSSALRFWYHQSKAIAGTSLSGQLLSVSISALFTGVGVYLYHRKILGPMTIIFLMGGVWWGFRVLQ